MAKKAELQVVQGNSNFTTNLYKVLAETSKDNIIFSPISVHAVLSMTYQGAQGTTAQHFAETLQVPDAQVAAEGYNAVMRGLNSVKDVTLLMANKIYLKEGAQMLDNFKDAIAKQFHSEVELLDFCKGEESARIINDWVQKQTRERIKDLIRRDDLDDTTRLVLLNAIYFKGNWLHKFNEQFTRTKPFYLNDVDEVDVEMMHIKTKYNYGNDEDLDAKMLQMFYSNEDLSMVFILPNKRNGIEDLEEKLMNVSFAEITQGMRKTEVNVALPRFKIEQTINLQDSLIKLGLGEIFDKENANFRGMISLSPGENLYVSKAIQKAFIEVNEDGAEAAAATVVKMAVKKSCVKIFGKKPIFFIADHPFIYVLLYKSSIPIFMGRIVKFM